MKELLRALQILEQEQEITPALIEKIEETKTHYIIYETSIFDCEEYGRIIKVKKEK